MRNWDTLPKTGPFDEFLKWPIKTNLGNAIEAMKTNWKEAWTLVRSGRCYLGAHTSDILWCACHARVNRDTIENVPLMRRYSAYAAQKHNGSMQRFTVRLPLP